jgi:tetratricopeptide (TPR) repeat protein
LKAAQLRFEGHLSQLRAAGKEKEASALVAKVEAVSAGANVSSLLDAAMGAGADAFQKRKFDEAERSYQEAVKLARQTQPHDARLVMSLGFLGALYYNRKDLTGAQEIVEQQLKASEEVYGAGSPQSSPVLESLARMSVELGDRAKGEAYAQRDLDLTAKYSGKQSMEYSASLMTMGFVYYGEKQYEKAAPYFEEAVKYYEGLSGPGELTLLSAERVLCRDYDSLESPAKSESCDRKVLPLMEKYYGPANPALSPVLESQAKALRKLGHEADAQTVEKRLHSLQQPVAGTNP